MPASSKRSIGTEGTVDVSAIREAAFIGQQQELARESERPQVKHRRTQKYQRTQGPPPRQITIDDQQGGRTRTPLPGTRKKTHKGQGSTRKETGKLC